MKNKKDYAFGIYVPTKNSKPVTYKGKEYLSKMQCMVLNDITRKELDDYLKGKTKGEKVVADIEAINIKDL